GSSAIAASPLGTLAIWYSRSSRASRLTRTPSSSSTSSTRGLSIVVVIGAVTGKDLRDATASLVTATRVPTEPALKPAETPRLLRSLARSRHRGADKNWRNAPQSREPLGDVGSAPRISPAMLPRRAADVARSH